MTIKPKSDHLSAIILVLLFLMGICVMLYPAFSDWWNANMTTRAVSFYQEIVASLEDSKKQEILAAAHAYNEALQTLQSPLTEYEKIEGYEDVLNFGLNGMMGYLEIDRIGVTLAIYHGTSDAVLNVGAGHLQGTSLPVGGDGTHAVISGHRSLPSAKLLTDLDQLTTGDTFTITILDEVYWYEVEQIFVVLPNETDKLEIVDGEDYVTLLTCTPYGINTHRLLVRGHRIDGLADKKVLITADAVQVDTAVVMPFIAIPLVIGLLVYWFIKDRKRRRSFPREEFLLFKEYSEKGRDDK